MSCGLFFPFCPIMLNLLHTEFVAMFLSMMRTDSATVAPSRALRKKTYRRHLTNNNQPLAASCHQLMHVMFLINRMVSNTCDHDE